MHIRTAIRFYGQFLLVLEALWMLFYIGVNIGAFAVSQDAFFMNPNSTAYGKDDVIRTSLRVFKSHILVTGTLAALVEFEWERPSYFGIIFFVFLLYVDASSLVEVSWFSIIRSFDVTQHLWIAAIALAVYQMVLTIGATVFYVLYVWNIKRLQQHKKQSYDQPLIDYKFK